MASTPTKPRLRLHHGKMRWTSRWYDDQGERHTKRFGLEEEQTHRQALTAYKSWLSEWTSRDSVKNPTATQYTYTCAQLAQDYLAFAREAFVKNGEHTSHCWQVAYAMQALLDTFGDRPASKVTNPDLAKLRDAMIYGSRENKAGETETYARARKTVNGRLFIIKAAYKWAREKGLVSAEALLDVLQVAPLSKRNAEVNPARKVSPVDEHWVAVTKKYLASPVAAMVELQWLTGMRPGEVCQMRPRDIDTTGEVWLYTPPSHKTEHMDKDRIIPLGPRCQKILKPLIQSRAGTTQHLFSPAEAYREKLEAKRAARKTKLYPSHAAKRNAVATLPVAVGDAYSEESYRRAIHHACRAAAKKEQGAGDIPKWNPNQLRHAAATRLNKSFGIEEVAVMLGHSDERTTRIYADPDVQKAVEIAKKVG